MDGLDEGSGGRASAMVEAQSRSRLTCRLDIVIRHLRAIRHGAVRTYARVERHLYISGSTYLAAIRSRRVCIINLVSISRLGQTCNHLISLIYSPTYAHVPSPRMAQTLPLCLSVRLPYCGRTQGNSIENDSILRNNGTAAPPSIDASDPGLSRRVHPCAIAMCR